jgi:hypothetical protein
MLKLQRFWSSTAKMPQTNNLQVLRRKTPHKTTPMRHLPNQWSSMPTHHIQMRQLQRISRCRQHRLRRQTDIFMLGHPLKIISINANTSSSVTEDFLQHAVENKTDLILVQEPWYYGRGIDPPRTEWGNFVSTTHSSFTQIPPNHSSNYRPRTLAYVSKTCKLNINLATGSPTDTDIQILDVTDGNNTLQIINLYNQRDQAGSNKNTSCPQTPS